MASKIRGSSDDDSELFSLLADYFRDITPCCQLVYNIAICMKLEFDRCHAAFVFMANTWEAFKKIKIRNSYLDDEYARNVLYERRLINSLRLETRPEYPLDFTAKAPTPMGAELYCHFLYTAANWSTVSDEQLARYIKTVYDFDMLQRVGCEKDLYAWLEIECHARFGFDRGMNRILELLNSKRELWEHLPNAKKFDIKPSKAGRPTQKPSLSKLTIDVPIVVHPDHHPEISKPTMPSQAQQSMTSLKSVTSTTEELGSSVSLQDEKDVLQNTISSEQFEDVDMLSRRVIGSHDFDGDKDYVAKAMAAFMMQHKVISAATEKAFKGNDSKYQRWN